MNKSIFRFRSFFALMLLFSSSVEAADFKPILNVNELVKISWKNGEAKIAMRNDWIARFLTIALNEKIASSPDIKSGEGEVHVTAQNPSDSLVVLGFSFDVIPDRVWFNPHVRCRGRIRIHFPQTKVLDAEARILDREPIEDCEVSGELGHGLNLGRMVKDRLNDRVAQIPEQSFLLLIGRALFGNEDLQERMAKMYLLQELLPLATLGMDDCAEDADLAMPMGNAVCLKLQWPANSYSAAVVKILETHPRPQPVQELIPPERIQDWRDHAAVCVHNGISYPSKGECDTGDMALFSGLLCLSGEELGCQMVRDSQGSDGRWWRSPHRRGRPGENFSPDMFLGVVSYLNQTRDQARLESWAQYILRHPRNYPGTDQPSLQVFQSCPNGANGVCNVMGSEWYWLKQMRPWAPSLGATPDYAYDPSWLVVESLSNERGFRLHLVAVSVLIQQMFGDPMDTNVALAAKILAAREPNNPFFVYLSLGRDQRVLDLMNEQCPAPGVRPQEQRQWSWERHYEEHAFKKSMGWDCVFMGNLWNKAER